MNELDLQRRWFAFAQLNPSIILASGKECKILDAGNFNTSESGPDFSNCKIRIDDITWVGSIEIHLKASDWYRHKHQIDKAYENVILHVVMDLDLNVKSKGHEIEHFCLKPVPLLEGLVNRNTFISGNFPSVVCRDFIQTVPFKKIEIEKSHALTRKWINKLKEHELIGRTDRIQVLYELIASSFGKKVNHDCFWMLSKYLPIRFLRQFDSRKMELLLMLAAGYVPDFVNDEERLTMEYIMEFHSVYRMNSACWKTKGLRPSSFPKIKLQELASFLAQFDWYRLDEEIAETTFQSLVLEKMESMKELTRESRLAIQVNAILPFRFWREKGAQPSQDLVHFLKTLPAEKNRYVTFFKKVGFKVKNAFDSQALLSLYRDKCTSKKCLNCAIGIELMRQ
jgi:hypothetical protein